MAYSVSETMSTFSCMIPSRNARGSPKALAKQMLSAHILLIASIGIPDYVSH